MGILVSSVSLASSPYNMAVIHTHTYVQIQHLPSAFFSSVHRYFPFWLVCSHFYPVCDGSGSGFSGSLTWLSVLVVLWWTLSGTGLHSAVTFIWFIALLLLLKCPFLFLYLFAIHFMDYANACVCVCLKFISVSYSNAMLLYFFTGSLVKGVFFVCVETLFCFLGGLHLLHSKQGAVYLDYTLEWWQSLTWSVLEKRG